MSIGISTGPKRSLFNLIGVLANPGDEFILIKPYWVSYADQIKYFDAVPRSGMHKQFWNKI